MIPSIEAIEYGRSVLAHHIERYRGFEEQSHAKGDEEQAQRWARIHRALVHDLYGYDEGGCVIVAFDKRWLDPEFRSMMEEARA